MWPKSCLAKDDSVPYRIVQVVLDMLLAYVYPGLLEGTRFHGRSNPLLGPGVPPPDDFDPPSTREHHKGWHPLHSHLLQKRFCLLLPPICSKITPATCMPRDLVLNNMLQRLCTPSS